MRTSVFVIFCLAVGIAPLFALPLDIRIPDPVLHTRGDVHSFSSSHNWNGAATTLTPLSGSNLPQYTPLQRPLPSYDNPSRSQSRSYPPHPMPLYNGPSSVPSRSRSRSSSASSGCPDSLDLSWDLLVCLACPDKCGCFPQHQ
ncbi:hypothetical protein F5148DRAFT_1232714 [Russula earlei]|uniref:Uncharacterized protein n=1 Tax=Russula earlei TaxID=71964 RepID=A0ACC0TZ50_9AGAM|nr:hypothetical protein F5148DRAFT_1232714 [Russula earlei]